MIRPIARDHLGHLRFFPMVSAQFYSHNIAKSFQLGLVEGQLKIHRGSTEDLPKIHRRSIEDPPKIH